MAPLASAMLAFGTSASGEVVGISPERVDSLLGQPRAWRPPWLLLAAALVTLVALLALVVARERAARRSGPRSTCRWSQGSRACSCSRSCRCSLAWPACSLVARRCLEGSGRRLDVTTTACSISPCSSPLLRPKGPIVNRVLTTVTAVAVSCFAVAALPSASHAKPHARTAQNGRDSDAVVNWNRFLLGLQATPGDQPATVHPTYELAIMHAAIDDAVTASAVPGRRMPRPPRTPRHTTRSSPCTRACAGRSTSSTQARSPRSRPGCAARWAFTPGSRPRSSCCAGAPTTARRPRRCRSRLGRCPATTS